ncbi:MAG TPA: Rrf2 family transcriptional regulator [Candidatus Omnitrophota bacterium]|nr:Rrf2 family transcriptional regulator [Candidatus Omnitrophota bacterium]HPS19751.1 Rrf2 family transcriptional regulator [Candidatus Omnitrophota bacterium]
MKFLTKNTDYAVRAIIELAIRGGSFIPASEISAKQDIPYQYLRRILQLLIKERVVTSREGASGGVKLKANPSEVDLVDIIKIFQGDIQLSECMFRKKVCSNRSKCVLRKRIKAIEEKVNHELEGITIQNLIDDIKEASNEKKNNKNR